MSTEKLNETLGVKLGETTLKKFRGVAEAARTTPGELARHLIEQHIAEEEERYRSLHSIFADSE